MLLNIRFCWSKHEASENINEMNLKLEAREEERDINRGMRSGRVT